MTELLKRIKIDRSPRLDADPGLYSCAVRYTSLGEEQNLRWAQYADISESGMRLISSRPHQTDLGTIVDLKFSLVGGKHEVTRKARVVRQANEFVLGLQFLQSSEDFKYVFCQHVRFVQRLPWAWPLERTQSWLAEHKIGLRIAVTAMTFFVFTASVIYLFSDAYANRNRAWGETNSYSQEK